MDKKCKGCKYRVFHQDDTYTRWGFCACRDIPKGENITKSVFGLVCADDYSRDVLSKLHEDEIPSCMIVQSFYDGNCPYYESDKKFEEEK